MASSLKIVSWNINGLSTIVHYHPWNSSPAPFKALLEQFDADIVCFQEHKLQRKDITFEMANIPGYDAFYSFSKVKKGYSGVAIYLRHNLLCLKAEEGLTGHLKSPSGAAYLDLAEAESIGGYPTSLTTAEALDLDSEGRAVVVELEKFVFISVYCPAVTIPEREVFRVKFLAVLEERVRNLQALGKSVVVAGDINVCREPIDTADPVGAARRTESGVFEDTHSRRWLRRLLVPSGPLVDTGRHFNPNREGMYTCWEQRIQARAGNYGSRIDYVLASNELLENFTAAGIDATILGSDHCPVWATMSFTDRSSSAGVESISLQGPGRRPPPRLCARYLSHVAPTQSIRSLFTNVPAHIVLRSTEKAQPSLSPVEVSKKREGIDSKPARAKRTKTQGGTKGLSSDSSGGQRSMNEFLKNRNTESSRSNELAKVDDEVQRAEDVPVDAGFHEAEFELDDGGSTRTAASQRWTSIFTKKGPPVCDAHGSPCIELVTKKPGPNLGRRFWICSKPVGPGYDNGKRTIIEGALTDLSGQKWEINPQYRCNFFKYPPTPMDLISICRWSSDVK